MSQSEVRHNDILVNSMQKEILDLEKRLSQLIGENNELESEVIQQSYIHLNQNRPKRLQSVLIDIENYVYDSKNEANPDYSVQLTRDFNERSDSIESDCEDLNSRCENKRQELLDVLKQINDLDDDYKDPEPLLPSFDSRCSEEVEKLAREFAELIKEVDEEKLIAYLARGPSTISIESSIEKIREIGRIRYQIRSASIISDALSKANDQLRNQNNDDVFSIADGSEELAYHFQELAKKLGTISMEDNIDIDSSNIQRATQNIIEASKPQENLRNRLRTGIINQTLIPKDIRNPENEKEALSNCLETLQQSISTVYQFLKDLEGKGLIECRIETEEVVRNKFQLHETLVSKRQ